MLLKVLFLAITVSYATCQVVWYQPEQIHLSYGQNTSETVVTWSTMNETKESIVEYGINGLILRAFGVSEAFVDGGPKQHTQYIHRVVLKDLTPNSKYGKYHTSKTYSLVANCRC